MIFGKHINKYYLKYVGGLILGFIALTVVDYVQLIVPNLYQMVINGINEGVVLIDGVSVPFDLDFLLDKICLPLIGIALAMVVGRFLWRYGLFGAAIRLTTDLRNEMFEHARHLSHEYYQENKVGDLMSLFTNDLETIEECSGAGFVVAFDIVVLGSLSVYKMAAMNGFLTLLAMIPMGILVTISIIVGKTMTERWETRQAAFSNLSDFSQESFSGIAVIKAFVKQLKELTAFKKLNSENEEANVAFTKTSVLLNVLVTLFVESVICIILGYGGTLVYKGVFNAGELMEFIGYFDTAIWPMMAISELIDMTSRGRASLNRVSELLDSAVDVADREGVTPLGKISGRVEFRDLTFRYPKGERDVLKNMSFVIEPGESVGLVGKTGSGKTTIVDLLLRIYNVPDGTVFLDGHDVNTVPMKDVRDSIAYVPQDNFLFSDTITNNIAFSDQVPDEKEVVRAAQLADVDDNIREFTNGYETVLGERGVTVSGGQKQRISIARALLKNAPILILDDSVSAVDTKTERTILKNLHAGKGERTTILIAHRISTIEQMDKIVFIENGTVVAVGAHTDLYESCPSYRRMVDLQKLEEEGAGQNA